MDLHHVAGRDLNDIFEFESLNYRLLQVHAARDEAFVIDIEDGYAWPQRVPFSCISGLTAIKPRGMARPWRNPSPASERARERAWHALEPLLGHGADLFDPQKRVQLIRARASTGIASVPSLYKWLRQYWQKGQTENALLPSFPKCGRLKPRVRQGSTNDDRAVDEELITGGRGAKSKQGHTTYQLTNSDARRLREIIDTRYLGDERVSLRNAYDELLGRCYSVLDGNDELMVLGPGQRPSMRQFRYFLQVHYPADYILRKRIGSKEHDLNHRGVLGTIAQDCHGVGHWYEADATIADVYLVAQDDVQTIVGKPTIYLIVDRYSRLIVGFYIGLENPSWACAKQALLSISEDKSELCSRYGVPYDAEQWPAHAVFPQSVLADLGEWNSKGGEQFVKDLSTKVSFTPSTRANWKPVVETNFKMVRTTLQPGTPGFDPPENAKKRQGKHYEKDACLTLKDFTKLMLEAIIKHNRTPVREFPLDMAQLREGFMPTPINIWNQDIATRSGLLTRYSAEHVRMQLLSRDEASVTEHGLAFGGCFYTAPALIARGWFSKARHGRFKVQISYDMRLVDNLYVHDPNSAAEPILCDLSHRSDVHRGRSFAEVKLYDRLRTMHKHSFEQERIAIQAQYRTQTEPTIRAAQKRLAAAPEKATRSARRADTKAAREADRAIERQATGSLKSTTKPIDKPSEGASRGATITDLQAARRAQSLPHGNDSTLQSPLMRPGTPSGAPQPLSLAERSRIAREKVKVSLQ